jgi:hypothetical protein
VVSASTRNLGARVRWRRLAAACGALLLLAGCGDPMLWTR